ncbi:hypothetical protein MATL_G00040010 [Megalops atlanticus]|uniref:Disks large homologue 1 N-terminal PEST domain-containing protein n=1 Tax=Megalops atlanticus TaxID=7932 RepID=A0A9D3TE48_MEGAT|nr:hypothetical protein MATL_G00040010 [Megalops atlanticus]
MSKNRPAAVQGSPHTAQPPPCMNPALMSAPWYRYQDEDSPPQDHGFPRLTNEVRAPELVHVSEKNLSEIENVHGYVSHSHISPLKPALVTRFDLTYPGLTAASYLATGMERVALNPPRASRKPPRTGEALSRSYRTRGSALALSTRHSSPKGKAAAGAEAAGPPGHSVGWSQELGE